MRQKFLVTLGALLFSLLAAPVHATEIGYTLDSAIGFTAGSASGTINPYLGPFPLNADFSVCLDGTCDLVNQDWLVVTVTVSSGSVDGVGIGALFASSLGIGYFLQGGPVQDGTGLTDTYAGDSTSTPTVPQFTFIGNGGGVGLTGTSLPLFVTYANGALPSAGGGPFPFGTAQFMVTEFGGAGIDSPENPVTTPIDIVPEPSTALLLGGGLMLLATRARRRRA